MIRCLQISSFNFDLNKFNSEMFRAILLCALATPLEGPQQPIQISGVAIVSILEPKRLFDTFNRCTNILNPTG